MVRVRQPTSDDSDVDKEAKRRVEAEDEVSQAGSEAEDDEEYEIEDIINHSLDSFAAGQIGYLVKWKGYDNSQNSWVTEEDAGNAQELIENYWKKKGGRPDTTASAKKPRKSDTKARTSAVQKRKASPVPMAVDSEEEEIVPVKKRGRASKTSASDDELPRKPVKGGKAAAKSTNGSASAASRKARAQVDDDDEDDTEYADMQKFKNLPSWEHLVEKIETVERTETGTLRVYFQLKAKNGEEGLSCREDSEICKQKMPNMLLEFYESNLRWRQTE